MIQQETCIGNLLNWYFKSKYWVRVQHSKPLVTAWVCYATQADHSTCTTFHFHKILDYPAFSILHARCTDKINVHCTYTQNIPPSKFPSTLYLNAFSRDHFRFSMAKLRRSSIWYTEVCPSIPSPNFNARYTYNKQISLSLWREKLCSKHQASDNHQHQTTWGAFNKHLCLKQMFNQRLKKPVLQMLFSIFTTPVSAVILKRVHMLDSAVTQQQKVNHIRRTVATASEASSSVNVHNETNSINKELVHMGCSPRHTYNGEYSMK